jgi:hypothetical protein
MVLAAAVAATQPRFASAATSIWKGGAGNWNDANWTPGLPTGNLTNVLIDNGNAAASVVTIDRPFSTPSGLGYPVIGNLSLDAGDTLVVTNQASLVINGSATVNGMITFAGTEVTSRLLFGLMGAPQTLSGSGQLQLRGDAGPQVYISDRLTIGPSFTVRSMSGGASIGGEKLINNGVLSAEGPGRIFTVNTKAFTNNGTLRATSGELSVGAFSWTNNGSLELSGNGSLNLGGNITTAGLGLDRLKRTGGRLSLSGVIDNTGDVLALNAATGSIFMYGTLKGGAVTTTGGALFTPGTLDNVLLDTDTTSSQLTLRNGFTLPAGRTVTLASGSTFAPQTLSVLNAATISGGGQILFAGTGTASAVTGDAALTISPGIKLRATTQDVTFSTTALTNQGLISAEAAGKRMVIGGATFTNQGTTQVTAGTLAITASNWANTGTLVLGSNTTFELGGTVTTAGLGRIVRSATATVNLTGTLDNTGTTLAITPATGSYNFLGTIRGGTVTASGGAGLAIPASARVTLDNVRLDTDLVIDDANLTVTNGLNLASGRTLTLRKVSSLAGTNALSFQGNQTLSGGGEILLAGSDPRQHVVSGTGRLTIAPAAAIRLTGQGGTITTSDIINQGLISAESAGNTLYLAGSTLVNQGTVQVLAGTLVIGASGVGATSWTNTGTLVVGSGGRLQIAGDIATAGLGRIVRSGGTIELVSILRNANSTLALNDSTGTLNLRGTISGGTVTTSDGAQLLIPRGAWGNLVDVRLDTDITIDNANLYTQSTLVLPAGRTITLRDGPGATLTLNGTTVSGGGQILFGGSGTNHLIDAPFGKIAPDIAIRTRGNGGKVAGTSVVNQGIISSESPGQTVNIAITNFTNHGTIQAIGGGTLLTQGVSGTGSAVVGAFSTLRPYFLRQSRLSVGGVAGDPASYGRVTMTRRATGGQTSVLKALEIQTDSSGMFLGAVDLADNALVLDYSAASPIDAVRAALKTGYNGGGWNGSGIMSSVAAGNASFGLGFAEASDVLALSGTQTATFQGQTVDATSVLVRYTLTGDVSLDGAVNFNDLIRLAQNYNVTDGTRSWTTGDFTFDGKVDFADLVLLAQNYNQAIPLQAVPGATPDFEADWTQALASVPEPGTACALGLLGCSILGRRRRTSRW